MRCLLVHSFLLAITGVVRAAVTVYGPHVQQPLGTGAATAPAAAYTGAASYDDVVLTPPPVLNPPPPTSSNAQLQTGAVPGISIPQQGSFFGFSLELSVTTQVLGRNSSLLQVPFLNLMANIRARAGSVHVRLGGNAQDSATLVDSIPGGAALEKSFNDTSNPTNTPPVTYTAEIIQMMARLSDFTNVHWYLGIPFIDTSNWRLQVAEVGESIPTIDPAALAMSNGSKGLADSLTGTSQGGGANGAFRLSQALPGVGALIAGAVLVVLDEHPLMT